MTPSLSVVNDDGGTATVEDFTVLLNGEPIPLDEKAVGQSGLNRITLDGPLSLYAITFSGDCDEAGFFSLALFDELTCEIHADDLPIALVLSAPLPNAASLVDETLNLATDSFLRDGVRVVQASTAEVNPLLTVTVPVSAVAGESSIRVLVTEGNADAARFHPAPSTVFVGGVAFEVQILGSDGVPLVEFPSGVELSFLVPEDVEPTALAAHFWDEEEVAWAAVYGRVIQGRLVVETGHLTLFALFEFGSDGGSILGGVPSSGVSLNRTDGGTLLQLQNSARDAGVAAMFITVEGRFVGYIFDAPAFVNAEFVAVTGGVLPPGQGLFLVIS